jgi:hypothetical protein
MKTLASVTSRLKRPRLLRASVCIVLGMLLAKGAVAQYHAIGPIYAEDCFDLGIKICSKKTVTEVRRDGQRYEIGRFYPSVSSYSNGRCSIDTKSRGLGLLSWGANAMLQPDFWGYDKDGKYGKIDADRIFFDCVKK